MTSSSGRFQSPAGPLIPGDINLRSILVANEAVFKTKVKVPTPIGDNDAVNKAYVDAAIGSVHWKDPCRAATDVSDIDLTTGGLITVDDVPLVADDRVLVKNQTLPVENGYYLVSVGSWERTTDMAVGDTIAGFACIVMEGTSNADLPFLCTSDIPTDIVGTSSLTFAVFSGGGGGAVGAAGAIQTSDGSGAFVDSGATISGFTLGIGAAGSTGIIQAPENGSLSIVSGDGNGGNNGGNIDITTGSANSDEGGRFTVTCGTTGGSPNTGGSFIIGGATDSRVVGGPCTLISGYGIGNGNGGVTTLSSGDGGLTGDGGLIQIISGDSGSNSGNGGDFSLAGGDSAPGNGGALTMNGGSASGSGTGGSLTMNGGSAAGSGPGGSLTMNGGSSAGSGAGGNVVVFAGNSSSGAGGSFALVAGNGTTPGVIAFVNQGGIESKFEDGGLTMTKGTVTQTGVITDAVVLNDRQGVITTVGSTLAADGSASFIVTNSTVLTSSLIMCSIVEYAGTGEPTVTFVNRANGSFAVNLKNVGSVALDDPVKIGFIIF